MPTPPGGGTTRPNSTSAQGSRRMLIRSSVTLPLTASGEGTCSKCCRRSGHRKPTVATKLKKDIKVVFDYALDREYLSVNPAVQFSRASLPPQPEANHYRSLPYGEVGAALESVAAGTSSEAVKLCFRWLILTAARSGEARPARWQDIDLQAKVWDDSRRHDEVRP